MRGQCLCGQVEFELLGSVPKLYQCHCSLCRKQTGSAANAATIVAMKNFRWLSGEERVSSWKKDSGFRSDFCSTCGSPVPNPLRETPYYWIPAGLLQSDRLEIVAHLFVDSKAGWDILPVTGKHYAGMPSLSELMEVLK